MTTVSMEMVLPLPDDVSVVDVGVVAEELLSESEELDVVPEIV